MTDATLPLVVDLDRAAELLSCSRRTVERMIAAGVLEARGKGRLRRVVTETILAYVRGDSVWDGASTDQAASMRTRTGSGGRASRSAAASSAGLVVLVGKKPSGKSRRG